MIPEDINAVYFLRGIADERTLYPIHYIGRIEKGNVKQQLLNQFFHSDWEEIVYIQFVGCDSKEEAQALAEYEINHNKPKYNYRQSQEDILPVFPKFSFSQV
jgi:hypothetical protein